MAGAFLGGDDFFDVGGEEDEADTVVVADGGEGEDGGDFGGEIAFELVVAAELLGGADVDEEHDGEFAFFGKFFDVGLSGAGGDVPVDGADVVAGDIFADFVEFHAAAFEGGVVVAGEEVVDGVAGADLNAPNFFDEFFGVEGGHGLGYGDFGENLVDECVGGEFFGFGFVGDDEAVAEDIGGDGFDVLWGDVSAALHEGVSAGGEGEADGGAGGGAVFDVVLDGESGVLGLAGGEDEVDDVGFDFVVDVDFVDGLAGVENLLGGEDGLNGGGGFGVCHAVEDEAFFVAGGVVDADFEHEAVDLGFGKGIGAFLFDGVFGGHDEEGFG